MENYEQKYKEALERANAKIETYNHLGNASVVKSICEIFPELKETDNEKIRKSLIGHLKECRNNTRSEVMIDEYAKWIAWLEKQGKKIDVIENFDTEFEKQVSHLIASIINKEYEYTSDFIKWTVNTLLNYAKHELEKKDGSNYPYQPGWRKNYSGNKPKVKHSVLMLTTHGIAEGEWLGEEWCQYRWSCKVKDTEVLYWMHLSDLENLEKENEKQGEQKPTWSEEDEKMWATVSDLLWEGYKLSDKKVSWYNIRYWLLPKIICLKDRVQPQPKQEWSEEEKARIDKIIDVLDWAEEKGHIHHSDWKDYVCYVKSLKPQNTWKPSDEQMATFWDAICNLNQDGYKWITDMKSLYQDLKKLKEE